MTLTGPWTPVLVVAVPAAAALMILVTRRRPGAAAAWTLGAAALMLGLVASLVPPALAGREVASPEWPLVPGVPLQLRVDALGLLFALVASALWLVTSVYSLGDMSTDAPERRPRFFACFAACLSATAGVAFAANLPTLFVFYEGLTLATYPLIVHHRTPRTIAAGRQYLVYTLAGGQALLVAVVWTALLAPGAGFRAGGFLAGRGSDAALCAIFALFVLGCGVKAGLMPLHAWLPAAMVAPTPVSALLHAVAVVKAGVFGCLRVVGYVFGVDLMRQLGLDAILAGVAAVTILLASLRALSEDHLKRRLAYSTISQLSYIVMGAALGSFLALVGAFFHLAAHATMKITLFFCAGAIQRASGRDRVSQLGGLGRRLPLPFLAFGAGALGLAGVPLIGGFVSKWHLGLDALDTGQLWPALLLVASGVLNLAYLMPIVRDGFFGAPSEEATAVALDARLWAPPVVTALASVTLGVLPSLPGVYQLAVLAAEGLTAPPVRLALGP